MNIFLTTASETDSLSMDTLQIFGKFVNDYGFLTFFGIIILIAGITYFKNNNKLENRRKDVELTLMVEEKKSTIESNKIMTELVRDVQTKQVILLEQISRTVTELSDFTKKVESTINSLDTTKNDHNELSNSFNKLYDMLEKDHRLLNEFIKMRDKE